MSRLKSTITWARTHVGWLAVAALPLILAACNNSGSGTGY
jgi:predicted small secreted protein